MDEEPTDFDYYDNSGRIQCYGCAMKEWMKTKEDEAMKYYDNEML